MAAVAVPYLTKVYGISGAAWGYALMMALLSLLYMLLSGYHLKKWRMSTKEEIEDHLSR